MNKNIIALIITLLLITSCGSENENGIKIEGGGLSKTTQPEIKVEYKRGTLHIGESVEITDGIPETFPSKFEIFKNSKTYTNSNVKDYLFHVNTNGGVEDIYTFYKSQFGKLGYTQIIEKESENLPEVEENTDLGLNGEVEIIVSSKRLEFVLRNPEYIVPKEGEIPSEEPELLDKVYVNINSETPENIKDGMDLEGVFTELYYNQLF